MFNVTRRKNWRTMNDFFRKVPSQSMEIGVDMQRESGHTHRRLQEQHGKT